MAKRTTDKTPDENETAARMVHEATCRDDKPSADMEGAWSAWSASIQGCDQRTMTLLQAAFEAGADFGRRSFGQQGARKGGLARSAALSDKRRKAIARKAAKARWGTREP
jgi:hypothetical protein